MKIELFFETERVELDGNTDVLLTRQLNDIYDPAKIKNDFSKSVSLPNTNANNVLLGKIFDVTKIIDTGSALNIGNGFNPSKKTNFKLFVNDALLYSGYCKLMNIRYESKHIWRYEVALFGELGNFLQQFENLTIKELLIDSPYTENRLRINRTNINNLWRARLTAAHHRESIDFEDRYKDPYTVDHEIAKDMTGNARNLYIDLIDAENGLYDSGDKVEFYTGFNSDNTKAITKLDGKITEQQLHIKKSYRQRFGFYLDILISTMLEKIGYTLGNIGGQFINEDNPYWSKLLLAAPILDTIQAENINLNCTGTASNNTTETTGNINYLIAPKPTALTANDFNISLGNELTDSGTPIDGGATITPIKFEQTNYSKYLFNYIMLNPSNAMFSPQMSVGTWTPLSAIGAGYYVKLEPYFRLYDYNTGLSTMHLIPSATIWLVDSAAADVAGNADNKLWKYYFRFIVTHATNPVNVIEVFDKKTSSWIKLSQLLKNISLSRSVEVLSDTSNNKGVAFMWFIRKNNSGSVNLTNESTNVAMSSVTVSYNQPTFTLNIQQDGRMSTNAEPRYLELLPTAKALEFFVSYIRLYGLYLDIDEGAKTVSLLTRNEYYSNNQTHNWEGKLDLNREATIIPLNFNSKYIKIALKDGDTDLAKKYKEKYAKTYGEILLNTGYSFNVSTYNLFEGIVFDTYATAAMFYDAYGSNEEPKIIPQLYSGELQSSKPANGLYLCFANGYFEPVTKVAKIPNTYFFIFTDDSSNMIARNEVAYNLSRLRSYIDATGWFRLAREVAGDIGPETTAAQSYLQTTPYYPSPSNIKCSLELGVPLEQYLPNTLPQGATIYNRFWKSYLEDRYSVQTRVLTAYVNLSIGDYASLKLSDFVWLKGRIWAINKIEDFNPLVAEPTKVELVSINDPDAYTEGQNVEFDTI